MKKPVSLLTLMLGLVQMVFGQSYGNNSKAGRYYDVRGIKMYVETYGQGPPLLLIHGNGGSIASFAETIPYFEKQYQVIAVDSRAHGKSVDTRDSISFEMMADDFAALLDEMHIKQCYVLGWSDGGINALLLAMRHPSKVIRLASTGANIQANEAAFAPGVWRDMEARYYERMLIPRITEKEQHTWKIFMLDYKQPNIAFTALKAIKCPSLIICGDKDVISQWHTNEIYRHIPQARLWVVPNSGHATLIEHRDEFNVTVANFFQKPFINPKH